MMIFIKNKLHIFFYLLQGNEDGDNQVSSLSDIIWWIVGKGFIDGSNLLRLNFILPSFIERYFVANVCSIHVGANGNHAGSLVCKIREASTRSIIFYGLLIPFKLHLKFSLENKHLAICLLLTWINASACTSLARIFAAV